MGQTGIKNMKKNRLLIGIGLILILTVLVVYRYGYVSLVGGIERIKDQREMKQKTLSKYHALISKREALTEEIDRLRNLLKDEELKLISGQTPALASASLQGMLKQLIHEKGVSITSERVERTDEKDGYRVVSVSFDMTTNSIGAISDILYNIESRTPYMVINQLSVRVRNYRRPSQLTIRLKVSGLSRS
jgi:hypothetical protein